MKTLIISDTHFGNHEDFANYDNTVNSRLLLQVKAFDAALKLGADKGCTRVIHLGDVFHKRGQVEPEAFNLVKETILKHVTKFKAFTILTGNHDITMDGEIFNTAFMLNGLADVVQVVTEPVRFGNEYYIPFTKEDFKDTLPKPDKNLTLYIHQSVFGAAYNRPIIKGVDPKLLRGFKRVYCGHIHQPQVIGNIYVVGAPYQINFGDSDDRHFLVDETGKLPALHRVPHPKFITTSNAHDVEENDGNFYRYVTDDPDATGLANVRVVLKQKARNLKRVNVGTDEELLAEYVKMVGCKDVKKYLEVGIKLLKGA